MEDIKQLNYYTSTPFTDSSQSNKLNKMPFFDGLNDEDFLYANKVTNKVASQVVNESKSKLNPDLDLKFDKNNSFVNSENELLMETSPLSFNETTSKSNLTQNFSSKLDPSLTFNPTYLPSSMQFQLQHHFSEYSNSSVANSNFMNENTKINSFQSKLPQQQLLLFQLSPAFSFESIISSQSCNNLDLIDLNNQPSQSPNMHFPKQMSNSNQNNCNKNRKKIKCSSQPKKKTIKFHEYKGPSSSVSKYSFSPKEFLNSNSEERLREQQITLQKQILQQMCVQNNSILNIKSPDTSKNDQNCKEKNILSNLNKSQTTSSSSNSPVNFTVNNFDTINVTNSNAPSNTSINNSSHSENNNLLIVNNSHTNSNICNNNQPTSFITSTNDLQILQNLDFNSNENSLKSNKTDQVDTLFKLSKCHSIHQKFDSYHANNLVNFSLDSCDKTMKVKKDNSKIIQHQKVLNETSNDKWFNSLNELNIDELEDLKVQDLKVHLKNCNLPVSGVKNSLVERLKNFLNKSNSVLNSNNNKNNGKINSEDNKITNNQQLIFSNSAMIADEKVLNSFDMEQLNTVGTVDTVNTVDSNNISTSSNKSNNFIVNSNGLQYLTTNSILVQSNKTNANFNLEQYEIQKDPFLSTDSVNSKNDEQKKFSSLNLNQQFHFVPSNLIAANPLNVQSNQLTPILNTCTSPAVCRSTLNALPVYPQKSSRMNNSLQLDGLFNSQILPKESRITPNNSFLKASIRKNILMRQQQKQQEKQQTLKQKQIMDFNNNTQSNLNQGTDFTTQSPVILNQLENEMSNVKQKSDFNMTEIINHNENQPKKDLINVNHSLTNSTQASQFNQFSQIDVDNLNQTDFDSLDKCKPLNHQSFDKNKTENENFNLNVTDEISDFELLMSVKEVAEFVVSNGDDNKLDKKELNYCDNLKLNCLNEKNNSRINLKMKNNLSSNKFDENKFKTKENILNAEHLIEMQQLDLTEELNYSNESIFHNNLNYINDISFNEIDSSNINEWLNDVSCPQQTNINKIMPERNLDFDVNNKTFDKKESSIYKDANLKENSIKVKTKSVLEGDNLNINESHMKRNEISFNLTNENYLFLEENKLIKNEIDFDNQLDLNEFNLDLIKFRNEKKPDYELSNLFHDQKEVDFYDLNEHEFAKNKNTNLTNYVNHLNLNYEFETV